MSGTDPVSRNSAEVPLFQVLLFNDDETPMEFVVWVFETMFGKTRDQATAIMLTTHHDGIGVCGIFSAEAADSLVKRVTAVAREHQHPLKCARERGLTGSRPMSIRE